MTGGPSHLETFDPKPELSKHDGQPLPASFNADGLSLQFMKPTDGKLMGSPFPFARDGESGLEICVAVSAAGRPCRPFGRRSFLLSRIVHPWAGDHLHDQRVPAARASERRWLWVTYGLGSESDKLPAFMVLNDGRLSLAATGHVSIRLLAGRVSRDGYWPTAIRRYQISTAPRLVRLEQKHRLLALDQLHRWKRVCARHETAGSKHAIANYELAFRCKPRRLS